MPAKSSSQKRFCSALKKSRNIAHPGTLVVFLQIQRRAVYWLPRCIYRNITGERLRRISDLRGLLCAIANRPRATPVTSPPPQTNAPPAGNRFDRMEWAGAFGDLGTLVPFVVAYIAVLKMDPFGILFAFGAALLICGLYYKTPFPVQPMKALGAAAITQAAQTAVITQATVYSAGLVTGAIWLTLGLSGAAVRPAELCAGGDWLGRPVDRHAVSRASAAAVDPRQCRHCRQRGKQPAVPRSGGQRRIGRHINGIDESFWRSPRRRAHVPRRRRYGGTPGLSCAHRPGRPHPPPPVLDAGGFALRRHAG